MSFKPKMEVLPAAQRALWPKLVEVPSQFVLYGGTALALRLGHRASVDFDFFSSEPFVPSQLRASLVFLAGSETLQVAPNTLSVSVSGQAPVKLSFFGGLKLGRVATPEKTEDDVLTVASLLDVAACKAAVVQERAEAKDYTDIWALLRAGLNLAQILGAAQAIYGTQFNPMITIKALGYFGDGDLSSLSPEIKKTLRSSATSVKEIPEIPVLTGGLRPKFLELNTEH